MARSANTIRLVPTHPEPDEETGELIEELGWERNDDAGEDVIEWNVPGGKTVVRWVVDGSTDVGYFVVEGPERKTVAKEIKERLDILEVDDFEAYLEQPHGRQGLMRALNAVAAAAPERCDPRVVELLKRYMGSDDPLIRGTALYSAAITGWPEFVETVRGFLDDPDPDARQAAQDALDILTEAD